MRKLIILVSVLTLLLVTACGSKKEELVSGEVIEIDDMDIVEEDIGDELDLSEEEINNLSDELSLFERGLTIEYTNLQDNGFTIVELEDYNNNTYYGILNPEFEWVLEPTNEIIDMGDFKNGLVVADIEDTREIRYDKGTGFELSGYINEEGQWQIVPKYRLARDFTGEVTLVRTIEDDRDDLANAREIAIDQHGNELGEIIPKYHVGNDGHTIGWEYNFILGYLAVRLDEYDSTYTLFNRTGKATTLDFLHEEDYPVAVLNDKLIVNNYEEEYIYLYTLNGELLKQYEGYRGYIDYEDSTDAMTLLKDGFFIIHSDEDSILLDFSSSNVDETRFENSYDNYFNKQFIFGKDIVDTKGNIITSNPDIEESSSPSLARYGKLIVEGNEYEKITDLSGNVLIGEDKKIYSHRSYSAGPIVEIRYRPSSESPDLLEGLLNIETLEMISFEEIEMRK